MFDYIILRENDNSIVDSRWIAAFFNEHFSCLASNIGFPDNHTSTNEAIDVYQNNPNVKNIRDS